MTAYAVGANSTITPELALKVGQAAGLGLIGYLSDSFQPEMGVRGLGMAMFAVSLGAGIVALAIFIWTAAQMRSSGYLAKM